MSSPRIVGLDDLNGTSLDFFLTSTGSASLSKPGLNWV